MMKYIVLFFSLSLVTNVLASSSLFEFDEKALEQDFKVLNQLEQDLKSKEKTEEQLIQQTNSFLNMENYSLSSEGEWRGLRGMDFDSMAWGLCCAPIGFFTVALNPDEDKLSKRSYWLGAGITTLCVGGTVGCYAVGLFAVFL